MGQICHSGITGATPIMPKRTWREFSRRRMKGAMGAHYLKEWREYRRLTQIQAAERANMSQSVLARLESGARKYDASHLEKLAKAYQCEDWELIGRNPLEDRTDVTGIWSRIPDRNRELARRALEAFTEKNS